MSLDFHISPVDRLLLVQDGLNLVHLVVEAAFDGQDRLFEDPLGLGTEFGLEALKCGIEWVWIAHWILREPRGVYCLIIIIGSTHD